MPAAQPQHSSAVSAKVDAAPATSALAPRPFTPQSASSVAEPSAERSSEEQSTEKKRHNRFSDKISTAAGASPPSKPSGGRSRIQRKSPTPPPSSRRLSSGLNVGFRSVSHDPSQMMDMLKQKTAVIRRKIAPSANSVAEAADAWGYCEDEAIDPVELAINRDRKNNCWTCTLTKLEGHWSMQYHLLPGITEVTGPGGNTDQANYQDQVSDLKSLDGDDWYMLNAVKEHELVHSESLLNSLKDVSSDIEAKFNVLTVPLAGNDDASAAEAAIRALPAFATAVADGRELWDDKYVEYIDADHTVRTPHAEHNVVDPMIEKIEKFAKAKGW